MDDGTRRKMETMIRQKEPGLISRFTPPPAIKQERPSCLNLAIGMALLRDRRVPLAEKRRALLYSAGCILLLITLQIGLQSLIASMFHMPGIHLAGFTNGAALIVGTVLFGALLLTQTAPFPIVNRVRIERQYRVIPIRRRD
jgi:hypothetical protein